MSTYSLDYPQVSPDPKPHDSADLLMQQFTALYFTLSTDGKIDYLFSIFLISCINKVNADDLNTL